MAQGTRVSGNLFYRHTTEDIFVEVDHGPFLIDNNLLLSGGSLSDASEGGAYVHNLIAGAINSWPDLGRETPYLRAHSTEVAGINVKGGDDRFFNNVFAPSNLSAQREKCSLMTYDTLDFGLRTGRMFTTTAPVRMRRETDPLAIGSVSPGIRLIEKGDAVYIQLELGREFQKHPVALVSTARLERARISGLAYESPDGSPLAIETDYTGMPRDMKHLHAGPFRDPGVGMSKIRVW